MESAQKSNWRTERWAAADTVSKLTLTDKQFVYRFIKELKETPFMPEGGSSLLDACLSQDSQAVEATRQFLKQKSEQENQLTVTNPPTVALPSKRNDKNPETPIERLRLALWYINKIGDPQLALEAVKFAVSTVNKLEP